MTHNKDIGEVVQIAQVMLQSKGRSVGLGDIDSVLPRAFLVYPDMDSEEVRQEARGELIRRYSIQIGEDTSLVSEESHEDWLNSARKKDWKYWQRYREWISRQLPPIAVDALDKSTDLILHYLEDPQRPGRWDRRGLVVGHVQSGKTGNYTGLICKAADAGYKIIIVLAGIHNNLRAQTQARLDEGFLGYETGSTRVVGVGTINDNFDLRPQFVTTRSERGDFTSRAAKNLGVIPDKRPWLFVIKKNKSVLKSLLKWIRERPADKTDIKTGKKVVSNFPLLVVDDEADHASVNTGTISLDGDSAQDQQPSAINNLVRQILSAFERSAYVGYTATPFANIFIHEKGWTEDAGADIFPSSFIVNLAAPSNYVGPSRMFGKLTPQGREGGLPLIREISDFSTEEGGGGWMPEKHKNGHIPVFEGRPQIPPSLVEAVDSFILACAVRSLRGHAAAHCSMLVHVTRFIATQKEVQRQISEHIQHMRQRVGRGIDDSTILARLRSLYQSDFVEVNSKVISSIDSNEAAVLVMPEWKEIESILPAILSDIQVKEINGSAKDALDYFERRNTGLKVIAVGGDKLSRGLTLEGLCTSYFLRASKMYDTLMQMGRWFGYRPGYLDLCRLYTTPDLVEWFGHITDASDELREEFELMAATGLTPRDFGLKVQSHPVLMVTSQLKMQAAQDLKLSFSGSVIETINFFTNTDTLRHNLLLGRNLLSGLGTPEVNPVRDYGGLRRAWRGYLWRNVDVEKVVDFLSGYQVHPAAIKANSSLLADFIRSMSHQHVGELTRWTVALIGGDGGEYSLQEGTGVNMLVRQAIHVPSNSNGYSIGRLLSPRDESIDLDERSWLAALEKTREIWRSRKGQTDQKDQPDNPSGTAIRGLLGSGDPGAGIPHRRDRGLLLLYLLDPKRARVEAFGDNTPPILAFGVSFPASNSGIRVNYKANNVYWEQEYGSEA